MPKSKLISTSQAAQDKACTIKAIVDAIKRGAIDGEQTGRYFVIRANRKYEAWQPNRRRQQIGRESQAHRKGRKR